MGSSIRKVNSCHGSDLKRVTQQVLAILLEYPECNVISLSRNTTLATDFEQLPHICLFTHLGFCGITLYVRIIEEKIFSLIGCKSKLFF